MNIQSDTRLTPQISNGNTLAERILRTFETCVNYEESILALQKFLRLGKRSTDVIYLYVASHEIVMNEYITPALVMNEYNTYITMLSDGTPINRIVTRRVSDTCQQMLVLINDLFEK